MTTCPRCGRVADDEFVCADCGAFLAAEREEEPPAAVPVRRVALLALLVCLLGVAGALVLLRDDGSGTRTGAEPLGGTSFPLSSAPLGAPGDSSIPDDSSGTRSLPSSALSTTASTSASTSTTASTSPHPSRSTQPTSAVSTTRSASHSTTPSPQPSTSHPTTTSPPSSSPPNSTPPPAVQLAKGGAATCGPHCYSLVVSLRNFAAGPHTVACWSGHEGQFGSYSTSATTSTGCSYGHPHDTVWVVVEGHRSNTVSW